MREKYSVSVIMPALNEEQNISDAISATLKAFDELDLDAEIIVVNDGSTDRTGEFIEKFVVTDNRVKKVTNIRNLGIGGSFMEGLRKAEKV